MTIKLKCAGPDEYYRIPFHLNNEIGDRFVRDIITAMVKQTDREIMQPDLFTSLPYGGHAGHKGTETSKEAARTCKADAIRERVLELYRSGLKLTADECAAQLNLDPLCVRPRVSELKRSDPALLRPTGETRVGRFGKQQDIMEATSNE